MTTQSFTSQQGKAHTSSTIRTTESNPLTTIFENNRPAAAQQDQLIKAIQHSPKTIAQRQVQAQLFENQEPLQVMSKEEELMQGKFDGQALQLLSEEEELLQGKFEAAPPIQQKAENGLPQDINSNLENTLGADFSNVNIHPNSTRATEMNALAYTQGKDVHFAPGQFKPNTSAGQQLIGHEFAHVVQQAEGKVKPTMEVNGVPVNDDLGLEGEADRIGERVSTNLQRRDSIEEIISGTSKQLQKLPAQRKIVIQRMYMTEDGMELKDEEYNEIMKLIDAYDIDVGDIAKGGDSALTTEQIKIGIALTNLKEGLVRILGKGNEKAAKMVMASLLGTISRRNGSLQVALTMAEGGRQCNNEMANWMRACMASYEHQD